MSKLQDSDFMPYGPYKGTMMDEVPAWWLLHQAKYWATKNITPNSPLDKVLKYVKENESILIKEVNG